MQSFESAASAFFASLLFFSVLNYHEMDVDDFMGDNSANDRIPPVDQTHGLVVSGVRELAALISQFSHISEERAKTWDGTVSELSQSCVPTFKFAFIGRTGSGKSTLLNSLLGDRILPTSASGACTSAVTEITYQDTDAIDSTIVFQSKEEWLQKVNHFLEDVRANSDSSEKSKETLRSVYPHLQENDFTEVTCEELGQVDAIQNLLGSSVTIHAVDAADCKGKLRQYLQSSSNTKPGSPPFWLLVHRVEIRGRFCVLASGITLVDLPGDGDIDDRRNMFTTQYRADGFVLVVDTKRAEDDRPTHDHLRKILSQLILDNLVVGEAVIVVATHADDTIGDDELRLNDGDHSKLKSLVKEIENLSKEMRKPTKHSKSQQELAIDCMNKRAEKSLFLANVRTAAVEQKLQDVFAGLNYGFSSEETPTRLPIFCVGSRDYLNLKTATDPPVVFTNESQTGIPHLAAHICRIGERRQIKWATKLLDRAYAFFAGVHSYFSEENHSGRLSAEQKDQALKLIADLEERNLEEANEVLDGVEEEFDAIEKDVVKAVKKAAERAPQIMKNFGSVHWSTYKAAMKLNGVFPPYDLNRELTKDILPELQGTWNLAINYRIPLILKEAVLDIQNETLSVIEKIVKIVKGSGQGLRQATASACESLAIEAMSSDLLETSLEAISVTQRAGTRSFKTTVQKQLTEQYQLAFHESGHGSWARMKKSNQDFIEQNAGNVFAPINIHISKLFHDSRATLKRDIYAEVEDISTLLHLSLVEEVDLSEDSKEQKDHILQVAMEYKAQFTLQKNDLADWQRKLDVV
ncbi:hypothetical protein B0H11DRAFT_2060184 [Mycena galericulata]|nr:hypothetical protein B0H11DRAFT_2060184 [Mycena galericulata]